MSSSVSIVFQSFQNEDYSETAKFSVQNVRSLLWLYECEVYLWRQKQEKAGLRTVSRCWWYQVSCKSHAQITWYCLFKCFNILWVQWLENDFVGYLQKWQQSVDQREGFNKEEKKKMTLSTDTLKGIKMTGKITSFCSYHKN